MSVPKPDRDEVYGKRDRRDVYPGPTDKIQNNPDRNKKAKPRVAPKPERRPVDERGVVRRGPGGPAAARPNSKSTVRRSPQEMDPGMNRRRGVPDKNRRSPQEMDPGMNRRRRTVPTPPPGGGKGVPRPPRKRKPGDRRA